VAVGAATAPVGWLVGLPIGWLVGLVVGLAVGLAVGAGEARAVGLGLGAGLGAELGAGLGAGVAGLVNTMLPYMLVCTSHTYWAGELACRLLSHLTVKKESKH
jgi:hypothetical protein